MHCEASELALASDRTVEQKADEAYFWADEQYWAAASAADAADAAVPTREEFMWALEHVWSRCLRLTAGTHGVRRLLVPAIDLANHDFAPSAVVQRLADGHGAPQGLSVGPAPG